MLKWLLILLVVCCSSCGDVLSSRGMSSGGELKDFRPGRIAHAVHHMLQRRLVIVAGAFYTVSFFSLLGLLSVAQLSVAVPATALSFVLDTVVARFYLREHVHWRRWLGVLCVTAGVVLTIRTANAPSPTTTQDVTHAAVASHK